MASELEQNAICEATGIDRESLFPAANKKQAAS